MTDRNTKDREPAEGSRDNVNVAQPTDEASRNPNRPDDDTATSGTPTPKRPSRDDVATQPPREEGRDQQPGEDNLHQNRRRSL